jgi:hypothetical protein
VVKYGDNAHARSRILLSDAPYVPRRSCRNYCGTGHNHPSDAPHRDPLSNSPRWLKNTAQACPTRGRQKRRAQSLYCAIHTPCRPTHVNLCRRDSAIKRLRPITAPAAPSAWARREERAFAHPTLAYLEHRACSSHPPLMTPRRRSRPLTEGTPAAGVNAADHRPLRQLAACLLLVSLASAIEASSSGAVAKVGGSL